MSLREIIPVQHILKVLRQYMIVWLGAALVFACLGAAYGVVKKDQWEAKIPLLVRDEATGAAERLGRFSSQNELTAAQETISELARNQEVVEAALSRVGPPSDYDSPVWPNFDVVASVTEHISVRAPKTSEFGKTEVVYLSARSGTPQQAEELCRAVFDALTEYLREVRKVRADSIIIELTEARDLAQRSLGESIEQLKKLEASVGPDLAELRGLSESTSSDVLTGRLLGDIQKELQSAQQDLQKLESQRALFARAVDDPVHLLISEGNVIAAQPTIERLKVGLLDAQLELSRLAGRLTPEHPRMLAAELAIKSIETELHKEVQSVFRAMAPAVELAQARVTQLEAKQKSLQAKLESLAVIRSDYSRMASEVQQKTKTLGDAEAVLTEAKALRAGVISANLISAVGPARCGDKPVGLGGKSIAAAATAAGLMFGLGCVFLIAPSPSGNSFGRRWSDFRFGRRESDQAVSGRGNSGSAQLPFPDRRRAGTARGDRGNSAAELGGKKDDAPESPGNMSRPKVEKGLEDIDDYLNVIANKLTGHRG